jgi:hypothetical protein
VPDGVGWRLYRVQGPEIVVNWNILNYDHGPECCVKTLRRNASVIPRDRSAPGFLRNIHLWASALFAWLKQQSPEDQAIGNEYRRKNRECGKTYPAEPCLGFDIIAEFKESIISICEVRIIGVPKHGKFIT